MKTMDEIRALPRTLIVADGNDGFKAHVMLLSSKKPSSAIVIGSWGGGWDHVSISYSNRTPSWDEMAEIKRMFFKPEETCFQLHPAEDEYVNNFSHCLHIWRPQMESFPTPPSFMVGLRNGESISDVKRAAEEYMRKWEAEHGDE